MQEAIALIFTYVWGAWRHRWIALATAWAIALGGWIWVWQLPEAYVAKARLYVDTNTVLRPLLTGLAIQPDISQRVTLMSRTLLSRPNLEKLMRMTDLDLEVNTDREKEEMLSRLGESISLGGGGDRDNANLYYISVRDEDRDTARRVAQALITVFIESSLGDKRTDTSDAQGFLDQQIADYEQRLIAAERRLAKFKQENVDMLPGGGGDYYSRLERARADLRGALLMLSEMENREEELNRQLEGEQPVFMPSEITTSVDSMSPLDIRIQALSVRRDDLLTRYTEKHPEVRQIDGLIRELEAEKRAEYAQLLEAESSDGFGGFSASPVYQGMRTMLAETEAGVAELRVRVEEYQSRVTDLESKVNSIPQVEAEFKQLDRDYAVVSRQHQTLLQRRESANISEDMEQNAGSVVFRVIDPPFVPSTPNEPDKVLLNGTVLFAALIAGGGVAMLLYLLSPLASDPQTLSRFTGMPMLGAITLHQQPDEKRAELYRLVTFIALTGGLLLTFVGVSLGQGNLFA